MLLALTVFLTAAHDGQRVTLRPVSPSPYPHRVASLVSHCALPSAMFRAADRQHARRLPAEMSVVALVQPQSVQRHDEYASSTGVRCIERDSSAPVTLRTSMVSVLVLGALEIVITFALSGDH